MFDGRISQVFLSHSASVLGETNDGLTGTQIVKYFSAYAIDMDRDIPHTTTPLGTQNKRTALLENIQVFTPQEQYKIIKELCELDQFSQNASVKGLKIKLISTYQELAEEPNLEDLSEPLIEETKHWLQDFPESLILFNEAMEKYGDGIYERNLLDDLRLSLEKLLKSVLGNKRSIENQISDLGSALKSKGGSPELNNMFVKLVDYFTKYHNTYIKHDNAVIEEEIEFVIEITSSFMKHIVRLLG